MERRAGKALDAAVDRREERAGPREVVLGAARVHALRTHREVEASERRAQDRAISSTHDAGIVEPEPRERLTPHGPRQAAGGADLERGVVPREVVGRGGAGGELV